MSDFFDQDSGREDMDEEHVVDNFLLVSIFCNQVKHIYLRQLALFQLRVT